MNLRAGFQFLSGKRDSPEKNLIIYTYNSIYKICSVENFNKESAEIVKKLVAQHEVTFKRYFLAISLVMHIILGSLQRGTDILNQKKCSSFMSLKRLSNYLKDM